MLEMGYKLVNRDLKSTPPTLLLLVEALLGESATNLKDKPKEKKKRAVAKLTEEMMMGPRGLTNLIRRANKFKKRSTDVSLLISSKS